LGCRRLGRLLSDGDRTGGAAWAGRHGLADAEQRRRVMLDRYQILYVCGVHPYAAHRAFLVIDEYQQVIKEIGCGPDKDEPGHDPNVGYGRVCSYPVPELNIFMRHGALHVWPAGSRI
jgi:hypothetical protein